MGQQQLLRHDPPSVARQARQHLVLGGGQRDPLASHRRGVGGQIHYQWPDNQLWTAGLVASVSEGDPDPSLQLSKAEGLGDEVISSRIERGDLAVLLTVSGKDQDRNLAPASELVAHVDSIHVRELEVEHHHLGTMPDRLRQTLCAGLGSVELVAARPQSYAEGTEDGGLIIDQQQAGHRAVAIPRPMRMIPSSRLTSANGESGRVPEVTRVEPKPIII